MCLVNEIEDKISKSCVFCFFSQKGDPNNTLGQQGCVELIAYIKTPLTSIL